MQLEYDIYKHVQFKGGAVYKTMKLGSIWLPCPHNKTDDQLLEYAKELGGDQLQPTGKMKDV